MKKYLVSVLVSLSVLTTVAQTESTLSFLDNVYQSSYYAPSNKSDFAVSIGLPGISSVYGAVANTGFSASDLFTDEGIVNDSLSVGNFDEFIDQMRNTEFVSANAQVDLFHIYINKGDRSFSFNITEKVSAKFSYPKDLIELALFGNGSFVGETVDLSGIGVLAQHYREYAFGYYQSYNKWYFGGKAKLLFGKYSVSTSRADISLEIDDDIFQHTGSSDITFNYGGFDRDLLEGGESEIIQDYLTNSANVGFALDLGASYEYSDKLSFNGALTDLGFISWKESVENFSLNSGQIVVDGLDVFEAIKDSADFEDALNDEFDSNIDIDTTNDRYRTATSWNLALGAKYEFLRSTYDIARVNFSSFRGLRTGITLGIYHDLYRWLNVAVTNTFQHGEALNLGVALVLKPGPIQFYIASDNWTAARFTRTRSFNIRTGINLVFGRIQEPEQITTVLD